MNLTNLIIKISKEVIEKKDEFTKLDEAVGDGDFGVNISKGANAILNRINELKDLPRPAMIRKIGFILNSAGCGTCGTLISFALMKAADSNSPDAFLTTSLQTIKERGGAELGDKTLVDALEPATTSFCNTVGIGLYEALAKASEAAFVGFQKTMDLEGKKGRAVYSRTKEADPGAYLIYVIFDCAAKAIKEEEREE